MDIDINTKSYGHCPQAQANKCRVFWSTNVGVVSNPTSDISICLWVSYLEFI
jgi:hypothetical protein